MDDIGIWGMYNEIMYYEAGCVTRPIDCAMTQWSTWTECDCRTQSITVCILTILSHANLSHSPFLSLIVIPQIEGVQTRVREIQWTESHGGKPCGLTLQQQPCTPSLEICPDYRPPSPLPPGPVSPPPQFPDNNSSASSLRTLPLVCQSPL